MLTIEMLPAGHGDCLWVEYGDAGNPHRILIDGGTAPTYQILHSRIAQLPPAQRCFHLFLITHVDADHIEGAVTLLRDETLGVQFDDVWFNGWKHLPAPEPDQLGPVEGEFLTALLTEKKLPWNAAFQGQAVAVRPSESLPQVSLPGQMKLTLLSPTTEQLMKLRPVWNKEVRKAGLEPGQGREALAELAKRKKFRPLDELGEAIDVKALARSRFEADTSPANGSSIALLAEYQGKRCLLAGDAYAPVLKASLERLLADRGEEGLELAAFKMSHHGSKANTSADLIRLVPAKRYLVSTNGKFFNHPDPEGIARAVVHGGSEPWLHFNYRTEDNEGWDDGALIGKYGYRVEYPEEGEEGLPVPM